MISVAAAKIKITGNSKDARRDREACCCCSAAGIVAVRIRNASNSMGRDVGNNIGMGINSTCKAPEKPGNLS